MPDWNHSDGPPEDAGADDRGSSAEAKRAPGHSVLPVFRLTLGCLIVALLVRWVGPNEVLSQLTDLPAWILCACVCAALLVQLIGAARVAALAKSQGLPLRTAEALSINLSAVFYGLFLPGGNASGLVIRLLRMSSEPSFLGAALVVLGTDRLFATGVGAGIGSLADISLKSPGGLTVTFLLVAVAVASCAAAGSILSPHMKRILAKVQTLPLFDRLNRFTRSRSGQAEPVKSPTLLLAGGLSVAMHVLGILIWVVLARALGIDLDIVNIAWVRSAALVVGLVPATVGGLGLREGAVVYLMTLFEVSNADALTLSLLAFAVTVLVVGLVGGLLEASRLLVARSTKGPVSRSRQARSE